MKPSYLSENQITGVILAGGQSRRMGGGDKFLKKVANKTILEHVINQFSKQCNTLIISANGDHSRLENFNLPIVKDPIGEDMGPLSGILAAMLWSQSNKPSHTHILSVAADSPLFPLNYTDNMLKRANEFETQAIILAKSRGRHHPIFGVWPIESANDLKSFLETGGRKIRAWTDTKPNGTIEFPDLLINDNIIDPFFNINEPEDLKTFIQLYKYTT
jgi:molybdopterin-guanine dinucleotide biosynthesis protein A